MGLLNAILGKAAPGGAISKPLMMALGTLIVGKVMHHGGGNQGQAAAATGGAAANGGGAAQGGATQASNAQSPAQGAAQGANTQEAAQGGAQDGGLLGGMGGLLEKLQDAGHGETAQSWVGKGQNKSIDPQHLQDAIGKENVSHAAQQAGMSEQELLSQLSKALPGFVDKLTANGKVPDIKELASALQK